MGSNGRNAACPGGVRRGFTLVELLVVVGVIAVLVGMLLPALGRARDSANLLSCQSNMRQVGLGLMLYASENGGSMPFIVSYPNANPKTGLPTGGVTAGTKVVWWASLVHNRMLRLRNNLDGESGDSQPWIWQWNEAFRCPEADKDFWGWPTQFQPNPVALVNPVFEANPTASSANARNPRHVYGFTTGLSTATAYDVTSGPLKPARISQLYPDTAVLWETNQDNNPVENTSWWPWLFNAGWGISGIDEGRLLNPGKPQQRYRSKTSDSFGAIPSRAITSSISMPDPRTFPSTLIQDVNSDSYVGVVTPYMIGGARFRHRKNTVCNVFFGDGSVRGLALSSKVEYRSLLGYDSRASDFKRYMLMLKWPSNRSPK